MVQPVRYRDIESAFFVASGLTETNSLCLAFAVWKLSFEKDAFHPHKHKLFPRLPLEAYHSGSGTRAFTSVYTYAQVYER